MLTSIMAETEFRTGYGALLTHGNTVARLESICKIKKDEDGVSVQRDEAKCTEYLKSRVDFVKKGLKQLPVSQLITMIPQINPKTKDGGSIVAASSFRRVASNAAEDVDGVLTCMSV